MPLRFKNPVFHDGINTTVRRGTKWSGTDGLATEIQTVDGAFLHTGIIKRTRVKSFYDLDDADISNEHDPECQNYLRLFEVMKDTYEGFDEFEVVTLVDFEIYKNDGR